MRAITRFTVLTAVFLHYSAGNLAFSIIIPLLTTLPDFLPGIPPSFTEAIFIFLATVTALAWGIIFDRVRNRKVILVVSSFTWITAAWCLATVVNSSWQFLIFRALMGIGLAGLSPFAFAAVGDLAGFEHRGKISSWLSTIGTVSVGMGILFSGVLNIIGGWRLPFLLISISGMLTLVFLLLVPQPRKGAEEPEIRGTDVINAYESTYKLERRDMYRVITTRTNLFILLQGIVALVPSTLFTYWLIAFLEDKQLDGIGLVSLVAIVIGLLFASGRVIGYPIFGFVGDLAVKYNKKGKGYVAAVSMLLQGPIFMLAMLMPLQVFKDGESPGIFEILLEYPEFIVFGLVFFTAAFIGAGSAPNKTSIMYDVNYPENRSVVQSLYSISDQLGASAALLLGSMTIPIFGYRATFFFGASLYLISAFFWILASHFYLYDGERLRDGILKRTTGLKNGKTHV
ncbi:MAG: MFS transporter [Candidatus Odinarchaeota archaeon]